MAGAGCRLVRLRYIFDDREKTSLHKKSSSSRCEFSTNTHWPDDTPSSLKNVLHSICIWPIRSHLICPDITTAAVCCHRESANGITVTVTSSISLSNLLPAILPLLNWMHPPPPAAKHYPAAITLATIQELCVCVCVALLLSVPWIIFDE